MAVAAAAAAPLAGLAEAGFPQRPVKMTVAFPPGGATDTIARELGQVLHSEWGQAVIIDNKPGAAGMIAAAETARAAPDGYSLFLTTDGAIVGAPLLTYKPAYDPLTDLT